ncbi:MAG: DEAD/DEAH box helicase [Desulfobulbaceae bacterium]|uniref:DEAD/DEAH box helicase n=1 Tax=Candidatus Desulfobia pelagia TaxID=2841692 RepID=A0A8J6NBJ6_9BACT|nr:DEAD/DEAH box helicase [Candidatus Desulfobia pelagia]
MAKLRLSTQAGDVEEYLASLKASPRFGPQVVHHESIAAVSPAFGEPAKEFAPELDGILSSLEKGRIYSHQAAAIDLIREGRDVIVATPTASGKSLIYNLPVFENVLADRSTSALYLFPLKALSQDQLRTIKDLADTLPSDRQPRAAICDGDTSAYQRKKIREAPPNILITNPDMLHLSMLGYHERWSQFWRRLQYVVIDEVHTYRGVFGSHVAWVIRRLQRICSLYGASPQFLLFSATVGNPDSLARELVGRPVDVVSKSGAPKAASHFVFFDPWDSAAHAASLMLEAALKRGLRTIVYTQSRKMTELVAVWTKAKLGDLKNKLTAYRAGFLPEERREIESKLSSGELYGVVSTSALELGIDIGSLDICILVGYPGSIMSTWQRSGRVGRRQRDSLVVLVGQEDALDQHFMRNPKDFFERNVESAVLNPANETIMKRHMLCAAAESPLVQSELFLNDEKVLQVVNEMTESADLFLTADGSMWCTGRKYPHREVNLRGTGKSFAIRTMHENELLGEIDGGRCLKECHPGAIYLHRGKTWKVEDLDLNGYEVRVVRKDVPYFTRVMSNKETEILQVYSSFSVRNMKAFFGYLRVTDQVTGFQKKLVRGQKTISTESLDLPPQVFETEGLWFEIPGEVQAQMEKKQLHFMGGIHAVEHAVIGVFPLQVLCDRNDVGGICYPLHPQLEKAVIFIYDGYPGGVGLAKEAYLHIEKLLVAGQEAVSRCSCEVGCPSCVHSPKCGSGNRPIDKAAALAVFSGLLEMNPGRSAGPIVSPLFSQVKKKQEEVSSRDSSYPGRYGVFDVETQRSAAEVGGWHRAERMGVSVAVLYDAGPDRYFIYRESEIGDLINHLKKLDLVVGFNNKRFDNRVLSAYTSLDLNSLPTLDLLDEVKNRLGYRLSLDSLAEHTLGVKKSGHGLLALKWYKEGCIDKIIEYCQKDVEITRDLFLYGMENRCLLFQNKAGQVIRCPVKFSKGTQTSSETQ